jgi:hypothetical protein
MSKKKKDSYNSQMNHRFAIMAKEGNAEGAIQVSSLTIQTQWSIFRFQD